MTCLITSHETELCHETELSFRNVNVLRSNSLKFERLNRNCACGVMARGILYYLQVGDDDS